MKTGFCLNIAAALLMSVLLAGCDKSMTDVVGNGSQFRVTAMIDFNTKVTYNEVEGQGLFPSWNENDVIFGFWTTDGGVTKHPVAYKVATVSDENPRSAAFDAEVFYGENPDKSATVYMIFASPLARWENEAFTIPENFKTGYTKDSNGPEKCELSIDISTQDISAVNEINKFAYLCASANVKGNSLNFNFKNQFSIIKFPSITNLEPSAGYSIYLTAFGGLFTGGSIKLSETGFGFVSDGKRGKLSISNPTTNAAGEVSDIYAVVAPQAVDGLKLSGSGTNKQFDCPINRSTLDRSKYYVASDIQAVTYTRGALTGIFTVGDNEKVCFSQGNLQYRASDGGSWRFADNQWVTLGTDTQYGNLTDETGRVTQDKWIDMFGWGTSGYSNSQPWEAKMDVSIYGPNTDFNSENGGDWGKNNISNGGNQSGQWRTPSRSNFRFLFYNEGRGANRYSGATIVKDDNVAETIAKGVLIFPDNWSNEQWPESVNTKITAYNQGGYSSYKFKVVEFEALQEKGVVFLPAAGHRYANGYGSTNVITDVDKGIYWTSTYNDANTAFSLYFSGDVNLSVNIYDKDYNYISEEQKNICYKYRGLPVRLIMDFGEPIVVKECELTETGYESLSDSVFQNW